MAKSFNIYAIPYNEIKKITAEKQISDDDRLTLLSEICRFNTFSAVKKAGSGHLGSSFSSLDIVAYLYFEELNVLKLGINNPNRDIYFSSKGHDCPGLYSVLAAGGIVPFEKLWLLRKLGGLDGHPDVKIPAVEANTGSLGMGISKARGMAWAKRKKNYQGRVIVMTGDGELQEGQIWESLQVTAHQKETNIIVIVDYNKIQTDKPVAKIVQIEPLEEKFRCFGWHVSRCNGHNFAELRQTFAELKNKGDKPKVIIADTVKGKGISFMEGINIEQSGGVYKWHSGAPADEDYKLGIEELWDKIQNLVAKLKLRPLERIVIEQRQEGRISLKERAERVVVAFGEELVRLGKEREDLVVLDADLAVDCGVRNFEQEFPDRFIENGIAEQDMVSMAGGLALQGFLPVVNSFGVFLSSRANEQIYNNATENTKIIYVCHYAGLIPAGPGKSHQSLRDISLFGALPNLYIVEPCNAIEAKAAIRWCVNEADRNCMLRLVISPSPRTIILPENYLFSLGQGTVLTEGEDAVIFTYGPVMLNEALTAAEILRKQGVYLKVINMPWLNQFDLKWLKNVLADTKNIFVLDNHFNFGGLGDIMLDFLNRNNLLTQRKYNKFSITEYPACGTPIEVLKLHGLDGHSLASKIIETLSND